MVDDFSTQFDSLYPAHDENNHPVYIWEYPVYVLERYVVNVIWLSELFCRYIFYEISVWIVSKRGEEKEKGDRERGKGGREGE